MEVLEPAEQRVLGALIEKEATTPEYYPLSLNALTNACNQRSNRYPVVDYDEDTVRDAIEGLRSKQLAVVVSGDGRVTKYRQRISETLNLGRRELAVVAVLLLRGPQTLGEIKDRSERLFGFADLDEAARALERLAEWPSGALVTRLPRQPGQKETRYAHLLGGDSPPLPPLESGAPARPFAAPSELAGQLADLRAELSELRRRIERLETALT